MPIDPFKLHRLSTIATKAIIDRVITVFAVHTIVSRKTHQKDVFKPYTLV